MVLANDFSDDKKSNPGPGPSSKAVEAQLQQPYIETDNVQTIIHVSSNGASESPLGSPSGMAHC